MWCVPVNSFAAPVQKCHLKSSRLVHVRFTRLQHFFYLKQVPVKICLCTHLLRQPFSRPTWVWVAHKSPFSHRVCMICCCPLTLYDTSSKHFCFLIRPRVFRFLPMCYTNLCFTYLLTYLLTWGAHKFPRKSLDIAGVIFIQDSGARTT